MKRKLLIILLALAIVFCCAFGLAACGDNAYSGNIPDNGNQTEQGGNSGNNTQTHKHSYSDNIVAPTCTEQGYTLHSCSCGDNYKDSYKNAVGHNFINYKSDNNATCTEDGTKTAKCERCDVTDTVTENGTILGHNYKEYICTRCDCVDPNIPATEGLQYTEIEENGEVIAYSVSGIGSATDSDIIIPSIYNDKPVTAIGNSAFYNCSSLTSVTIGKGVSSIAYCAFGYCSGLMSVIIPDSVTSINNEAFTHCCGLMSITIAERNGVYHSSGNCIIETASKTLIAGCSNSVVPTEGSVTSIGTYAFRGQSKLTSIAIPDNITSIGEFAFEDCSNLIEITIPDSVTKINARTFNDCSGLTSVKMGNGVTSIGNMAFSGCSSLTEITIPDSVISIGTWAFSGCSSLTEIAIPDSVTSIDYRAFFNCNRLWRVMFANPIGWRRLEPNTTASFSISNLSIPSTAATYLKSTYCNWIWKRS